jgi:hypothetical protein
LVKYCVKWAFCLIHERLRVYPLKLCNLITFMCVCVYVFSFSVKSILGFLQHEQLALQLTLHDLVTILLVLAH